MSPKNAKTKTAYFLEPVGSVRPKIPSTDDVRGFRTFIGDSPALMCPAQGFPVPLYRQKPQRRHHKRTRVLRDDRSSRVYKFPIINGMIRADRQREAQVPDDRRLQELPHNEGRLGHVAVPRSGFPCPPVQVSRATRKSLCMFFPFSVLLGSRNPSQNLWEAYVRSSPASAI